MTDHAKALRYIAALVESPPRAAAICYEAADEIDRLRAEVEGYREANKHLVDELDDALEDARKYAEAQREIAALTDANRHQHEIIGEQAAEIARLREALDWIAKGRTGLDPEESDAEWRAYWANLCIDYRSKARAALAPVEAK